MLRQSMATKVALMITGLVLMTAIFVGTILYFGNLGVLVEKEQARMTSLASEIANVLVEDSDSANSDIRYLSLDENLKEFFKNKIHKNVPVNIGNFLKSKPSYGAILFFDRNLTSLGKISRDGSFSDEEFFLRLDDKKGGRDQLLQMVAGEVWYSPLFLLRAKGKVLRPFRPATVILTPYIIGDNLYGFLGIQKSYLKKLNEVRAMANGHDLYLIGNEGDFYIHPVSIKEFGKDLGMRYLIQEEESWFNKINFFDRNLEEGEILFKHSDREDLIVGRKVYLGNKAKNNFLGIYLSSPKGLVVAQSISVRQQSYFTTIVLLLVTALGGWFFTRYLLKNLVKITDLAKRYTRGETGIQVDVDSKDEIGILAVTFQGMLRQVNERTRILKKNQREVRDARDQAEQALKMKSQILNDLQKKKEEVEKIGRDKDELLAIVSHDLKNPLAVIETSMDIIMEDPEVTKSRSTHDLLRRSKLSARFALNLITDLLDLARLEGGIKLDFEKFDVRDMFETVIDSYFLKCQEKNIEISISFEEEYELYADYGRCMQVINNILGNALKFTPKNGKIKILVSSTEGRRKHDSSNRILKVTIEDNGPGIPEDKISSIFDKFEQARVKDREIGTGLGLAICKNICNLHNGNIWVESKEGHGAKFIITLPRVSTKELGIRLPIGPSELAPIWIIEQNEEFRKSLVKRIQHFDLRAIDYSTTDDIDFNMVPAPSLIIYSLDFDKGGSCEKLKELHEESALANIPIIVISENLKADIISEINLLANDYLRRDFDDHSLKIKLDEFLGIGAEGFQDKTIDSSKSTVLVVDDEDIIRDLMAEKLESLNYNVLKAKNGAEALFLFKKYPINLVVADIRMPEIDGLTLSRILNKDHPGLPIILMSGNLIEIPSELKKKLGVRALLSKPFDLSELAILVKENLAKDISEVLIVPEIANSAPDTTKKLLLVDDSEDMQSLVKVMTKHLPVDLTIASNGQEGFDLYQNNSFDLVLMDINMPVLNGLDTIKKMRDFESDHGKSEGFVVAISANNSKEDNNKYQEAGFSRSIGKPLSKDKIMKLLEIKAVS